MLDVRIAAANDRAAESGAVSGAGPLQGWVLVATAWLSVIASSLIGPVLPRMTQAFAGEPSVGLKLSLVATFPALFVALLAAPFGILADRVGHKRVLFGTTILYGFFGTAPLWLGSLDGVVASRALVGVAEAAIMTCGTALIGDLFAGKTRERWLAMQTGTAPFVSTAMLALGGALGDRSWRAPFMAYGFAFALIPLVWFFIPEPGRRAARVETAGGTEPTVRWGKLMAINAVTVFALTAFLVTIIQGGYLLNERGITSPSTIGLLTAAASLANPTGAVLFAICGWRIEVKLAFAFTMLATGFAVIALLPGPEAVIGGAVAANLGGGFVLPTLITWALADLPPAARGRGTGLWMAASFLGQFLSPLVVLFLSRVTGSLDHAVLTYSVLCAAAAAMTITALVLRRRHP